MASVVDLETRCRKRSRFAAGPAGYKKGSWPHGLLVRIMVFHTIGEGSIPSGAAFVVDELASGVAETLASGSVEYNSDEFLSGNTHPRVKGHEDRRQ